MGFRLPAGGIVDRDKPVGFSFNGRKLLGLEGDTLASALLANDVAIVGRSFKYHRPRGIVGAREDDPNGILDIGVAPYEEPNARATLTQLHDGLAARSIHCWPSVGLDFGAVFGLLKPLIPAGFYYKTFMWPDWHLFEPAIRRAAGLGQAPRVADPDCYEHESLFCDVLIVGGGPAGLQAAKALAETDLRIVVVDQDGRFGGSLLASSIDVDGGAGYRWVERTMRFLQSRPNVTLIANATATGHYDGHWVTVSEKLKKPDGDRGVSAPRGRFWHVSAKRFLLATGAHERPLVFRNNDRPGIMLASAVRAYANRYGVAAGRNLVFFTNNTSAYGAAFDCQDRGCTVTAVADTRPSVETALQAECASRGIRLVPGAFVSNVVGRRRVRAVHVKQRFVATAAEAINCDCLAVSGGWSPVVHLAAHGRGRLQWDDNLLCFLPGSPPEDMVTAGSVNGLFDTADVLRDATAVADLLIRQLAPVADGRVLAEAPSAAPELASFHCGEFWKPDDEGSPGSCWVDQLHDVTLRDIAIAARENFASVEHMKRYTTLGMAPDQGKTSNIAGMAILARETARTVAEVGTTTFRPPYTPVTLAEMAGTARAALYRPLRRLALHDWHVAQGASMEDYGGWLRPALYLSNGADEDEAIAAEVANVRTHVGVLDYSPLGKIDVVGPDAADFLDRIYMTNVATLRPGAARYGLMLNEDGSIKDDGVFCRLADGHFMMTTTSGGAAAVAAWLEEWHQCEWPQFDIVIRPLTTYWGTINLAGPSARAVIARLRSDIDVSSQAFPHMSVRTGMIEGVNVRVMRVSYSGEVTYEISAPIARIPGLWMKLLDAGSNLGIRPFGLESLMVMRTEKGFLHVGAETDSSTLPGDMGFGQLGSKKKVHFIGRRSLLSPNALGENREQLVGLVSADGVSQLRTGGQVVRSASAQRPIHMIGRVTSSYWSPTLGRPIALGLVERGRERHGDEVDVYQLGSVVKARITNPCFYDADGSRMNA